MKPTKLVLGAAIAAIAIGAAPSLAHDGDHTIHKRKCAAWKATVPDGYKTHYAYAENTNGSHCGIAYNYQYLKDAEYHALKSCKYRSPEGCRLIYSK